MSLADSTLNTVSEIDHEHGALERSEELTAAQIVGAASLRAPEALFGAAREKQTRAYEQLARGYTPGTLSWQSSLFDDGLIETTGVREIETSLQFGLWHLGERDSIASLATSLSEQFGATQEYIRWLSAGRVRTVLAALHRADATLQRELAINDSLKSIARVVERLVSGGELAEFDSLRIDAELLEQSLAVVDAEAAVVDAERDYFVITGLNVRPAQRLTETLATVERAEEALSNTDQHPLLSLRALEHEIAQSNAKRQGFNSRSRSTLSFGARRERGGILQPNNDTLGFGITLPLGGRRLTSAAEADAHLQTTQAAVVLLQTQRQLEQQKHEAEHALSVNEEALNISGHRLQLARRRLAMTTTAFEQAETDLESLLRVRRQVDAVERDTDMLLLRRDALIAEYNQVVGVLP